MDPRLQQRVQRYGWDKAVEHYEKYWADQLLPAQDRLMSMAALQPGERVLDVACGTGLVTFRAAEAVGATGSVVASDISDRMVEVVQQEANRRSITNISASRSEAEQLRYEDAEFDVVLCALGLMYVTDPAATLGEMRRVLRGGGRMVAAVWGARKGCGWAEIFPIVEKRVQSEVCPLFFQLGTGNSLSMAMEACGFRDILVDRITTTLHYDNGEDACGAAFAGGPVAMAYSRFDEKTRTEAFAEYLDSIGEYRLGDGYEIPGEFVIARGSL
jgi:ubiquinone/menaquinone biosynthesis C-methylase UbiE